MINSPSPSPSPFEWGGSGESGLTLYICARHGAIVRIFDTAIANCEHAQSRDTEETAEIRRGHARRIIGKMMLIGLVLFATWARTVVSELRKFPSFLFVKSIITTLCILSGNSETKN